MKALLAVLVLCCQSNLIQAADNTPAIPVGCVVFKRAVDAGATFVEYRSFKDFGTTIVVINTTGDEARVFGYYEPIFIPYPGDQAADRQKTLSLLQLARKTYPDMTRRLALVEKAWAEAPVRTVPAPAVPQASIAVRGTEIVTTNGTRYSNARVTSVDGGVVTIAHDAGVARVRFTDLPDDVRKKYGVAATKGAEGVVAKPSISALTAPAPVKSSSTVLSAATKEKPFVNALGMKFVPVPITGGPTGGKRVLFSVWDTRVQDYAAYANENPNVDIRWKNLEFLADDPLHYKEFKVLKQGPTHPVVNVNWNNARAFCAWLTRKERAAGRLGPNDEYRLPSDHEWSCAMGIGSREDASELPGKKSAAIDDAYLWGNAWPPPKGAGNYASSLRVDNYEFTSPVGMFPANQYGLYDMGGNVYQWCEDSYEEEQRVMRGASWSGMGSYDLELLASFRLNRGPTLDSDDGGFRVVLTSSLASTQLPAAAPRPRKGTEGVVAKPSITAVAAPALEAKFWAEWEDDAKAPGFPPGLPIADKLDNGMPGYEATLKVINDGRLGQTKVWFSEKRKKMIYSDFAHKVVVFDPAQVKAGVVGARGMFDGMFHFWLDSKGKEGAFEVFEPGKMPHHSNTMRFSAEKGIDIYGIQASWILLLKFWGK